MLFSEFKQIDYTKSRIVEIANRYKYYQNDVEDYLTNRMNNGIYDLVDINQTCDELIKIISENKEILNNSIIFKKVKNALEKSFQKSIFLSLRGGFISNSLKFETGIKTADEGDGAEFIFVGRAMLQGFNCSLVDLRSSRSQAFEPGKALQISKS